jgi:hypothetical protein
MSTNMPPMDRFFPFQTVSLFFKELITGFHVSNLRGLAPTGSPKKRKGALSMLQYKKFEAAAKKVSSMFHP